MRDGHRASQPERNLRRRHVLGRHLWGRRTFQDRCVTAGAIQFHPEAFNYPIDPQYLACQPVLNASSGVAMVDIAAPMLPGWPWGSTRQRKNSRLPRPIGPQRADGRRLIRSSGPGRRHPHSGQVLRSLANELFLCIHIGHGATPGTSTGRRTAPDHVLLGQSSGAEVGRDG
jgi:hypothetical protein